MNRHDENEIRKLILDQYERYPLSQIQDMLKLLYQNEFGCGHMAPDKTRSLSSILEESEMLPENAPGGDVFENIGNGMCRLHLRILRQGRLAPDTLNGFFIYTAGRPAGSAEGFEKKAAELVSLCNSKALPFEGGEVLKTLDENRAAGYPAMRHSLRFREAYAPAYRVVSKIFCDFLPLFCRINELMRQKECLTVAIDGNSAAGKSSLAKLLESIYSCNIFKLDDFFLRPFQRTQGRLGEPGGNIDYERFGNEIIEPLKSGRPFTYKPYNCRTGEFSEPISATPNPLNIIEGVYSLHPRFAGVYDIKVFLCIGEAEQRHRLQERGADLYDRFIHEWIPMETRYFDYFEILDTCDLIFCV